MKTESPYYETVIRCYYEDIIVSGHCYIIKMDGYYGVFADNFDEIAPFGYDYVQLIYDYCDTYPREHACYILRKEDSFYLLKDARVIEMPGEVTKLYLDKYALFVKDGKYGLADHDGKTILNNIFDKISLCSNNRSEFDEIDSAGCYFMLERNGKFGAYSPGSTRFVPCIYNKICFLSSDSELLVAHTRSSFSIFNLNLQCVVPLGYEKYERYNYEHGMRCYTFYKVYLNGKVGIYSSEGQCVPCSYDDVQIVLTDYNHMYWLRSHDNPEPFWFIVTNKSKKGLVCLTGEPVVPCLYDDILLTYAMQITYGGRQYRDVTLDTIVNFLPEE